MKIPTSFMLHGQRVTVKFDDRLCDKHDHVGQARHRENRILLQSINPSFSRDNSQQEQWFCHELTHFILNHMSSKLNDDESFVDSFAHLLHQALTTAEYE